MKKIYLIISILFFSGICQAQFNSQKITRTANAGLTASTTQTQAGGLALTAEVNDISVIANDNDAVTLPALPSSGSLTVLIINDDATGNNTLQIFPAPGDDLGLGVNLSISLEVNESVILTGTDATDWHIASSTEISHAEMQDDANTDAFVINAQSNAHVYHSNGLAAGDLSDGWTFDAGGGGASIAISSIADGSVSGVTAAITCGASHNLASGAIVSLTNMSAGTNAGTHVVLASGLTSTVFEITSSNNTTATGTMDEAATLTSSALAVGTYLIGYSYSTTTVSNNETLDFDIFINATAQGGGLRIRNKFGTGADFNVGGGTGLIDIVSGDKISLCVQNNDSAGNLTIRNFGVTLIRL